ncbi:MAG: insulinase family protein [Pseudomonadota bacterium]|nr:insulinase family protein [Pseudomonadota bacterium]
MSIGPPRSTGFDNGLTVVTRYTSRLETDIAIRIRGGSAVEAGSIYPRGIAHFDEHITTAGSLNFPRRARSYIESVEGFDNDSKIGNHFTPATQFQFTNYDACVPFKSADRVLDIMLDMIANPICSPKEVEINRKYITNESIGNQLGFNISNLENWVVPSVAFGDDPRFCPVIGDKRSIQAITADQIKEWHAQNMTAANTVIVVEGDVNHDDVVAAVKKRLLLLPGSPLRDEPAVYTGGDLRYWTPGDGGTHVALAFQGPPEGDFKEGIAFKVLGKLLTARTGKHSIPETLVSDELGTYNYGVNAWQTMDSGLLVITFNQVEVVPCLEAIQKILFDLTEKVDPQALAKVREDQKKHIAKVEKGLSKIGVVDMAEDVFVSHKVLPSDHYSQLKLKVTEEEIMAAARAIVSKPVTFVAAGDLQPLPNRRDVRDLFLLGEAKESSFTSVVPQQTPVPHRYALQ